MRNKNNITGDAIVNNKGNSKKYSNGWDAIWGKKKKKPACGKKYIYESPDKGETVYAREFGKPHDERVLIKGEEQCQGKQ